jgi:spore germination protein KC
MIKYKPIILISIMAINTLILSGCWNYREINDLTIVSGVAIDKGSDNNKYLLTCEIVVFRQGGKGTELKSERIESEGKTMFDAIRNAISISGKRLYWSHLPVIIISQEVAKEGILPIVDFFNRDNDLRKTIYLVVSKEKTAKELLIEQQSITTDIRGFELDMMLKANKSLSKAPETQLYEFVNILSEEETSPVLPAVEIVMNQNKKTSKLSGMALFNQDKLLGFLGGEETKFYLIVKNKFKAGVLTLKDNSNTLGDAITLEVFKNKTNVKPIYSDGKLSMQVNIKTEVAIAEVGVPEDYIGEKGREKLKTDAEQSLKTDIQNVIEKIRNDYRVDAFGFGSIVKREMPDLWGKIHPDWNTIYKDMDINVVVEIDIRNSALIQKPIKMRD